MRGLLRQQGPLYGLLVLIALVLGILVSWKQLIEPRRAENPAVLQATEVQLPSSLGEAISGLLVNEDCRLRDVQAPDRTTLDPSETEHGFQAALVQLRFTLHHPEGRTPMSIEGSGRGPNAMANAETDTIEAARDVISAAAPTCIEGD